MKGIKEEMLAGSRGAHLARPLPPSTKAPQNIQLGVALTLFKNQASGQVQTECFPVVETVTSIPSLTLPPGSTLLHSTKTTLHVRTR